MTERATQPFVHGGHSYDEAATALSELSDNRVLLTDVTLHVFMVCY